jgi:hypothetical protein
LRQPTAAPECWITPFSSEIDAVGERLGPV